MADYVKTISDVYLTQLHDEIVADAGISTVLDSMQFDEPDSLCLKFNDVLDASEEAALDAVIAAHVPYTTVLLKIRGAQAWAASQMEYWQEVIIKEGVVQAGKAHDVSIALKDASILGWLGNLYALDAELANVTPVTTFLEQARIDLMRNNVRSYLGLPLLWDAALSYSVGDVVHHAGADYSANTANSNDAPPSANWDVV